ncbi:nucleotidyltransferase domain-containing protein [Lentzea terrae]|uniref:nucleotidyltransferase domain-containing protein n=1 Tax=Lentzea terrae TaxID=2200761 RepID=UPI001E3B5569|nr:hypothetical protein [Lentzea terrae]
MSLTELPWDPLRPAEVAGLFTGVQWWVAGGYAIELAVGRPLRPHSDIDVLLLRRDQLAVQRVGGLGVVGGRSAGNPAPVAAWRALATRCSRHLVPPSRFRALAGPGDARRIRWGRLGVPT